MPINRGSTPTLALARIRASGRMPSRSPIARSPSSTTAARGLQRIERRYAVVSLCVGLGQGVAMVIERCR
ncbi:acetyl-CoA acetyltransferase [Pseudomonas aeruginosa]|nr:acetyl-CoA acetyltransferase [Pseudomonas aeruginosa]